MELISNVISDLEHTTLPPLKRGSLEYLNYIRYPEKIEYLLQSAMIPGLKPNYLKNSNETAMRLF